jgi:hypothetical protein
VAPLGDELESTQSDSSSSHEFSPLDEPKRELGLHLDSTRFLINDDDAGMESDTDVEELSECGEWEDDDLQESMYKLAVCEGDDPSDEDWLPYELRKKKKLRTGQISRSFLCKLSSLT